MKKVIRFKSKYYQEMEAGQTIQGEVIEVVAAPSQAVEPQRLIEIIGGIDPLEAIGNWENADDIAEAVKKHILNELKSRVAPAPQSCEHDKGDHWKSWTTRINMKKDLPNCPDCPAPKAQADEEVVELLKDCRAILISYGDKPVTVTAINKVLNSLEKSK